MPTAAEMQRTPELGVQLLDSGTAITLRKSHFSCASTPADPRPLPPLEHIEQRGVSAAFLQQLTANRLEEEGLKQQATAAAITFLMTKIGETENEIERVRATCTVGEDAQQDLHVPEPEPEPTGAAHTAPARYMSSPRQQAARTFSDHNKLHVLQRSLTQYQADLAAREARPFLTSRDVHRLLVVAETKDRMCRYVELPDVHGSLERATGQRHVGTADYFFSYSWDSPWEAVVSALVAHTQREVSAGNPPPFYWIDIFAVNQHLSMPPWRCESGLSNCPGCAAVAADMHDWSTADPINPKGFERVIAHTKHTLVLNEPWAAPRPPTRVWCLFEGYQTLSRGGTLEVVLGHADRQELQLSLNDRFADLKCIVQGIDARTAEATVVTDRDNIFTAIAQLPGGFDGLNQEMRTAQRRWLAWAAAGVLERTDPSREALSAAALKLEMGPAVRDQKRHAPFLVPGTLHTTLVRLERWPRAPPTMQLLGAVILMMAPKLNVFIGRDFKSLELLAVALMLLPLSLTLFWWSYALSSLQVAHQLRRPALWNWKVLSRTGDYMMGALGGWFCPVIMVGAQLISALGGPHSLLDKGWTLLIVCLIIVFPMFSARSAAVNRARLAVKAGWLRLEIEADSDLSKAEEQFAAARDELQSIVGVNDVQHSHIASPGHARSLCDLGRREDAIALEALVRRTAAFGARSPPGAPA